MNLFLAILLKNFEDQKNDAGEVEEDDDEPGIGKSVHVAFTSMRVKLKRVLFRDDKKKVGAITKVVQSEDPGDGQEEMEGGSENESPDHAHEHNHEHGHEHDHDHQS